MSAGKEGDLIQVLARRFLGTSQDEDALAYLRQPIDWADLLEISSREGMGGLLAIQLQGLARSHALELPLGDFSNLLRHVFACNGGFVTELSSLRTALEQHGIQVIVLKGGALIRTVYRRQLGLRPLSDIDLLIKSSDLDLIQRALHRRGFRSIFPSGTFLTNGPVAFDLHLDLVGSARIRRRGQAFRFDPNELWKKALPLGSDVHKSFGDTCDRNLVAYKERSWGAVRTRCHFTSSYKHTPSMRSFCRYLGRTYRCNTS